MRIAVLVLAILGCLATGGAGLFWGLVGSAVETKNYADLKVLEKFSPNNPLYKEVKANNVARARRVMQLAYFLLAAVPLGIAGGVLAMLYFGKSAAALLLTSTVGPVLLAQGMPGPLIALATASTGPLGIAGLLALAVYPPRPRRRDDDGEEE
jgi:hypothetical protein